MNEETAVQTGEETPPKADPYISIDIGVPKAEVQTFASAVPISSIVPIVGKATIAEPAKTGELT